MTYAVGIDFGTESARALLVDCSDGSELGTSIHSYENGVLDSRLPPPDDDVELGPDCRRRSLPEVRRDVAL